MIAAMVLAAGFGTRLRPLTDRIPKPLVPVGDRPVVAHVLERLLAAGAERVVVNAHHRAQALGAFVRDHYSAFVSEELELLGTAGGVAHAGAALGDGDVLVWNADIVADVDPRELVGSHARTSHEDPSLLATLVVRPLERGAGALGFNEHGDVVRLRQERLADEVSGGEFLGIHVMGKAMRGHLPTRGCLVGDVYVPALRAGGRLATFPYWGKFFDIGTLLGYVSANMAWLAARELPYWTAPSARIGTRVTLRETLVSEGACVDGVGALERCIVWPHALVTAPQANAVAVGADVVRVPTDN